MSNTELTSRDPVLVAVGESCMRLMGGMVPGRTMQSLCSRVMANPDAFPWREVTDEILAEPVEDGVLLQSALRGQRDWILRGGAQRKKPRKSMRIRGKTWLAYTLARSIFFVPYTAAVIVLLILMKHKWPSFDIYVVLDWLAEAIPGFFGPR